MAYDTTRLIAQVKLRANIPTSQNTFSDTDILDVANDCMLSDICPWLIGLREEFFLRNFDQNIIGLQSAYKVTDRSLGNTLREVQVVRNGGLIPLDRKDVEELVSTSTGTPSSFALIGGDIVLYPTPSSTVDTLRQVYFMRPGKLVPAANAAQVLSVNFVTNTVTFANPFPATFSTSSLDLIRNKSGFEHLGLDMTVASSTTTTITFNGTLPTNLAANDWVAVSGESPIPQLPMECHVLLIQSTATVLLESLGQLDQSQNSAAKTEALRKSITVMLSNRIQGAPRRIKSVLI